MTPDMIAGIAIGAACMGLLIAVLYLWMPRKVERHIVGLCVLPGGFGLMHRSDRYVQDRRGVITLTIKAKDGQEHLTPEQVTDMLKQIDERTGVR